MTTVVSALKCFILCLKLGYFQFDSMIVCRTMEELTYNRCVPLPLSKPHFPDLQPEFPPNYYSKVIKIKHMYKGENN